MVGIFIEYKQHLLGSGTFCKILYLVSSIVWLLLVLFDETALL